MRRPKLAERASCPDAWVGANETGDLDARQAAQRVEPLRLSDEDGLTTARCRILSRAVGGASKPRLRAMSRRLRGVLAVRAFACLLRCMWAATSPPERSRSPSETSAVA